MKLQNKQLDLGYRMLKVANQQELLDIDKASLTKPVAAAGVGATSTPAGASASAPNAYLSDFTQQYNTTTRFNLQTLQSKSVPQN